MLWLISEEKNYLLRLVFDNLIRASKDILSLIISLLVLKEKENNIFVREISY